jgi:regulatory protein
MHTFTAAQKAALIKLTRYCAYQERCHAEAREKLATLGLYGNEAGEVIIELARLDFLNEERFAKAFVRGKFRFQKWGKIKIANELRQREVSDYCVSAGFLEIEEEEYLKVLKHLAEAHWGKLTDRSVWAKRKKTGSYLMNKGYEPELVFSTLKELTEV